MNEIQQMREALDNALDEDLVVRDHRIKAVKADVTSKIRRGIPVGVTQEMIDLGIDKEIREQLAKAEIAARIKRLCEDEDDELEVNYEPHRPVFF